MARTLDSFPPDLVDYIFADYQDNVWYNGDQPAGTVEELRPYWDEYVSDRKEMDYPVPEGLTVELYVEIWDLWYETTRRVDDE